MFRAISLVGEDTPRLDLDERSWEPRKADEAEVRLADPWTAGQETLSQPAWGLKV